MRTLLGVTRYEYIMCVRRWGVWIALIIASMPKMLGLFGIDWMGMGYDMPKGTVWQIGGEFILYLNFLAPVVGGIALADRLARDNRLGVRELLLSTQLSRNSYVFGKFFGSVLAVLTPNLMIVLIGSVAMVVQGLPVAVILTSLIAFLAITVPAYVFVGAFAIACPAVMPVRIFQVLFTGYWIWGNFMNPDFIPSLSETILTPAGHYAASGFFGAKFALTAPSRTVEEAVASLVVLWIGAMVPLLALRQYLVYQDKRA